ncbi:hypothetical protein MNEG_3015 [Monoraphidium neglectum]|uniref:Uncharacterized protein n=1 Tax=Monoraphidium neglectum TaxID=145388 RepID=A0A0D2MWW5_9CHLO|nr:hypothetical protein MNEG_3015 [Monoraphidium neglectum]KIZ04937.1 hypothetical protein MNEG_3015 [Monoraphidium neglectum]|eukprot:XP_013903956.1 hypothetical protein MNEG_3015 [Monoraphidium neglectum]
MNGLRGISCATSLNKKPAVVIKNNSMVRAKRATYQPSKPQAVDELVAPRAQLVKDTRPSFTCMLDNPITLAAAPAASPVPAPKSLLFPFDDGFVPIFRSSCASAPASASTTQVGPSHGNKKRKPIKMKINKTKDTSATDGTSFESVPIVACSSPSATAAAGPPPAPLKARAPLALDDPELQRLESLSFEELLATCYEDEEKGNTTAAPIKPVTITANQGTSFECVPIIACPSPSAIAAAGPPPAPLKAPAPLALEDPELHRLESLSFEQLLDACLGQEEEEQQQDTAPKAPLPAPSAPEAFTIPACSLLPGAMICPVTGASEAPDTIMWDVEEEPFFEVDGEGDVIMTEADPIEPKCTSACFMAPPPLVVGFAFALLPKPVVEVPPVDPMTTLGLPPFSSLDDLRSSLKMPPAPVKPPRAASSWDYSPLPLAFSPSLALAEDATTAECAEPVVARKARKVTCTEGPAYNTRSISRRGSAIAYRTRARSIW